MKITIEFTTDNAWFGQDDDEKASTTAADLLDEIIIPAVRDDACPAGHELPIMDGNGNTVGFIRKEAS